MRFDKNNHYYKPRTKLIDMIPVIQSRILEIGCGDGITLEYLKSKGALYVAGIDISKKAIDLAAKRLIDLALVADVEKDIENKRNYS